jgi:hypothetical protein
VADQPVPGTIDLSATFGAVLPTGTKAIAGPGVQPYLQYPWSWELGGGWGLSGMLTNFFAPADPVDKLSTETTFVIEREFGKKVFAFVEYVGDYHEHGGPSYLVNSGAGYRITNTQQIDFTSLSAFPGPALDSIHSMGMPTARQSCFGLPKNRSTMFLHPHFSVKGRSGFSFRRIRDQQSRARSCLRARLESRAQSNDFG